MDDHGDVIVGVFASLGNLRDGSPYPLPVAFANKGKARMTSAGFAVFGCAYFLIALIPDRSAGSSGGGPMPWPSLMIEWGTARLRSYLHPMAFATYKELSQYYLVSHSLGIILFSIIGAVIGRFVAPRDDRLNP